MPSEDTPHNDLHLEFPEAKADLRDALHQEPPFDAPAFDPPPLDAPLPEPALASDDTAAIHPDAPVLDTPLQDTPPTDLRSAAPGELRQDDDYTTALYRAAIGPVNSAYYLPLFTAWESTSRWRPRWNWAAAFCTVGWLLFRKMGGVALAYVGALAAALLLGLGIAPLVLDVPETARLALLGAIVFLAIAIPGLWGNVWFHAHCRKRMALALQNQLEVIKSCEALAAQASQRKRGFVIAGLHLAALVLGAGVAAQFSALSSQAGVPMGTPVGVAVGLGQSASGRVAEPPVAVVPVEAASGAAEAAAMVAAAPAAAATSVPKVAATAASGPAFAVTVPATPATTPARANEPATGPAIEPATGPATGPAFGPASAPISASAALALATPSAAPKAAMASLAAAPAAPAAPSKPLAPPAPQAAAASAAPTQSPASAIATTPKPQNSAKAATPPPAAPRAATPPNATANTATPAPPGAAATGRYGVNVGLFANEANAKRTQAMLEAAKLSTLVDTLDMPRGVRTRVRVGPLQTKADAARAVQQIKSLGLDAIAYGP